MKKILLLCTMLFLLCSEAAWAANQAALDHAKDTMKAGRYATAIEELQTLLEAEQANYQAWFLFGVSHALEQQYNQAIEAFRQVIFLRPDLAEPHNNLAGVYSALGDPKMAVQELEKALQKQPDYAIAEENIANLYIDLALKHYRNSLEKASSPLIEQRFARLLQVRNPTATSVAKIAPDLTVVEEGDIKVVASESVVPDQEGIVDVPVAAEQTAAMVVAEVQPAVSEEQDLTITGVLDALEAWRLAWSAQNLDVYFAAYAADYVPDSRFLVKQDWLDYKKRVVGNKTFIKVTFEDVNVNLNGSFAEVTLFQRFRSNTYNGNGRKQIIFKHGDDGWKIMAEVAH